VERFGGTRSLIITHVGWIGGENEFFGIIFLVVGGLAAVCAAGLELLQYKGWLPLYRVFTNFYALLGDQPVLTAVLIDN
jgi:hypothetical protein